MSRQNSLHKWTQTAINGYTSLRLRELAKAKIQSGISTRSDYATRARGNLAAHAPNVEFDRYLPMDGSGKLGFKERYRIPVKRAWELSKEQAKVVDGFALLRELNNGSMAGDNIFKKAIGARACEEKVKEALGFLERETVEPVPWAREGEKSEPNG